MMFGIRVTQTHNRSRFTEKDRLFEVVQLVGITGVLYACMGMVYCRDFLFVSVLERSGVFGPSRGT